MTVFEIFIAILIIAYATLALKAIVYNFRLASKLKNGRSGKHPNNIGNFPAIISSPIKLDKVEYVKDAVFKKYASTLRDHRLEEIMHEGESQVGFQKYKLKLISQEMEKINTESESTLIAKVDAYLDLIIADLANKGKFRLNTKL